MTARMRSGNVGAFFALAIFLLAIAGALTFALNKLDLLPSFSKQEAKQENFGAYPILKSYKFTNSNGEKKRFLVVLAKQDGNIPIADTYIAGEKQNPNQAIKINELSNDSTLGYAAQITPVAGSKLNIEITGGDKKYIVLATTIGTASTITIIGEDGQIQTKEVIANILKTNIPDCPCKFNFDSTKGNDQFYVRYTDTTSKAFKILIDIPSGNVSGKPEKTS